MLTSAQRYIAAVIANGSVGNLLSHGPVKHLFKGEEAKLWDYFDKHVKKFGTVPDFDLLKADTGYDFMAQPQPAEFYLERARDNHVQLSLMEAFQSTHDKFLKTGPGLLPNPTAGLASLASVVSALTVQNMGAQVLDYRESQGMILQAFNAKLLNGDNQGLMFGWPTLDGMTGGLGIGDMINVAGRPGAGKTWWLLWAAMCMWNAQNKTVLFISGEIKPLPIMQRLFAIHAQLPIKGVMGGQLSTAQKKQMTTVMKETEKGLIPFHVVDANLTATVDEVYALTCQLKPDVVFIDGAYLLGHPTERDMYKRVAENAVSIKKRIADLAPTICSWQFARPKDQGSTKKGPGKKAQTMDEFGSTDAIAQLSSLAIGIMEDDSIETIRSRKVSILKGRQGEEGSFQVKWDFEWTTDFSEIVEAGGNKADYHLQ